MSKKGIRVEPYIYKQDDGSYLVEKSYRVKINGKKQRRYKRKRVKNLTRARQEVIAVSVALSKSASRASCPKFKDLVLNEYGTWLEQHRQPSTLLRQMSAIRAHLLPLFGDHFMDELTAQVIEDGINSVMKDKRAQTKKHLIAYCNEIFRFAVKRRLIQFNPCDQIERPKIVRKDPLVLAEDQAAKLVSHLWAYHRLMGYHVALALHTLCRAGELRALTWADVNLPARYLVVNKTCDPKTGLKLCTKNSEMRRIPINEELCQILLELRQETYAEATSPVLPHWREFASGEQGKPLKIICRDLGLPLIRFHDLRATGITLLLLKGVPLPQVMLIAGHKRMSSTNIYLRVSGRDAVGATSCLRFFGSPDPSHKDSALNSPCSGDFPNIQKISETEEE